MFSHFMVIEFYHLSNSFLWKLTFLYFIFVRVIHFLETNIEMKI